MDRSFREGFEKVAIRVRPRLNPKARLRLKPTTLPQLDQKAEEQGAGWLIPSVAAGTVGLAGGLGGAYLYKNREG